MIQQCRICRAPGLDLLIDYGQMPNAGAFAEAGDPRLDARYPLRLGICRLCGVMQTMDCVPADEIFRTYSYASSSSLALIDHFEALASILPLRVEAEPMTQDVTHVDIGCNDGILIKPMIKRGFKSIGVDPSDVARSAGNLGGWDVIPEYLTADVARRIGKVDLVTACNVLAHTDDPHSLFEGVAMLLLEKGLFMCEVHSQLELVRQCQFDTVYHEHTLYYTLGGLARIAREHGLYLYDMENISTHSGSMRAWFTKGPRWQPTWNVTSQLKAERDINPDLFADQARAQRQRVSKILRGLALGGRTIDAYGAAGRCTTLLNWCGLDRDVIRVVIDRSPLRAGRLVPGVKVPIVPPDRLIPDIYLITAWNYAESIKKQHPSFSGIWAQPLPQLIFS